GTPGSTGDGGPAAQARLENGSGVAVDQGGNVYIASSRSIRKLTTTTGAIDTIAGDPGRELYGDDGPATQARLVYPRHPLPDSSGNLYIADNSQGPRVRRVDAATGSISTLPIHGQGILSGLAMHPNGKICFTQIGWDTGNGPAGERTVSCLDPATGTQTRIAGQWYPGDEGDGGPASGATFG